MSPESARSDLAEAIITVSHEAEDGWHTFVSEEIPGLFLTGRDEDLEALYEALPGVIADLARADFGVNVVVSAEQTFSFYVETLPTTPVPPKRHYSIRPQAA